MKTAALDCALLILLAAVLVWPLFQVEYFDNWMSIDGGFIGDARFLSEHLPRPGWTPSYYCGNRFDYLYPPGMRYAAALLARYGGVSPARAYRIYSALLYCVFVAGVYVFFRTLSGSRAWALAGAVASLAFSPVLLLFRTIRDDSALHMPQRLNVIVRWGEAPHMSALGILLFALAAAWVGLRGGRSRMPAVAAVLCALCAAHNFYGAVALAVCFSLMVWTLWAACGGRRIWLRAAAIVAVSYGLSAWWLTPSYLALTAANLRFVARPGNTASRLLAVALLLAFAAVSFRMVRRKPELAWPVFLCGLLAVFGLSAAGGYYFNFHAMGEPARFVPEFDLLLIVAALECIRRGAPAVRIGGGALLAASLVLALPYLQNPWGVYVPDAHPGRRIEFRLAEWLARNLPGARVHTASSLGFWANVRRDVPQVGGISDQGMQNRMVALANWQILMGDKPERDIHWLQALGADAIVVHGARSQEIYRAIRHGRKFAGRLPVLYDSGEDDIVYRVPRRFPGLARVVQRRRMQTLAAIPWSDSNEFELRAYAEALEQGPDSAAVSEWVSPRAMRIRARVGDGESVAVQVSHDRWWRAYSGGRRLTVDKDVMGFLRIDPPAGEHEIRLEFETPLENRLGGAVSTAALILVLALCSRRFYI